MRTKEELERARDTLRDAVILCFRMNQGLPSEMVACHAALSWMLGEEMTGFGEMIDKMAADHEKAAAAAKAAAN